MLIDRPRLEGLIPHGRKMCQLDQVLAWDREKIICKTTAHRRQDNPLKEAGRLGLVTLVEFGAQAAAVHIALSQQGSKNQRVVYLGAIKDLTLSGDYIEEVDGFLTVEVNCILNTENGAIYSMQVHTADQELISGRLSLLQEG